MSYLDLGFNKLINKSSTSARTMLEDEVSSYIDGMSGSSISGGTSRSAGNHLTINWDTGEVSISDGAYSRVLFGYIAEEDAYGIKIRNSSGEVIFSVAGQLKTGGIEDSAVTDAKITSVAANKILTGELIVAVDVGNPAAGYIRLDGVNNRIIVNDGSYDRIVIGEV